MSSIAGTAPVPGSRGSPASACALWCAGRKATSCSTTPGASAKPGRSPGASAPGERRPNCCGIHIFASIAAPACSPCPCVIPSIKDACGWWSCERRKGREPWYLLTNEPVETEEQAWEIAFSYVSRWTIEEQFRFQQTELLIESLRLRDWEPRRKLLLLVTLAYSFLLWMLAPCLLLARSRLLLHWGPRADWRQWTAKLPIYRLRWALSRLWLSHPPSFPGSGWGPFLPPSPLTWPPCSF